MALTQVSTGGIKDGQVHTADLADAQITAGKLHADALDHTYTLGASGTDHYTFTGEGLTGAVNDATLYLTRGKTYRFVNGNSSGAHPFRIQSVAGAGGSEYNTGVTNNAGAGGSTIIFEVPHDAPDVLYYICTSHATMNGIFYVTGALSDGSVTTAKLAADAVDATKLADNAVVTANITDDAITSDKIAANPVLTGTSGVKLPVGTTAQRVNTEALLRYNSETDLPEYYNGSAWVSIDTPPIVNSVTPTEVDSTSGGNVTFTINGDRFGIGVTVKLVSNNGTELTPSPVTRVNANQLTAVIATSSFVNAQEPYDVKVLNANGLSSTLADQINVDVAPTWSTSAGSLGTISDVATGTHATLSASDADGDTIAYSITSGSIPAGTSLNSASGVLSGDPTNVTSSTTSSFTARATAGSKTVDRAFSIIVNPSFDGSSSARAAGSAAQIATVLGTTPTNGSYWIQNSGINSSTPFECYCDWSIPYFNDKGLMILQQAFLSTGTGNTATTNYTDFGTASTSVSGTRGHGNSFSIRPNTILNYWSGDTANRGIAMMYANDGNIGTKLSDTDKLHWVQFAVSPGTFKSMFDNDPGTGGYTGTVSARGYPTSSTTNGFADNSTTGAFYWSKNTNSNEYNNYQFRQMHNANSNGGWNANNYMEIRQINQNSDPNHGFFVAGDGLGQYMAAPGDRNYTFARAGVFAFSPNNVRT